MYNGGLFVTISPTKSLPHREQRIARFLADTKCPIPSWPRPSTGWPAIQDDKTFVLVFIDYKSLEVRHLGSIYEGLLEFKLNVADEDLTTQTEKKAGEIHPACPARGQAWQIGRDGGAQGRSLSFERQGRAQSVSGSYYTPDAIVEYIVEQTVGPCFTKNSKHLRTEFRKVRKTFDNEIGKVQGLPPLPRKQSGGHGATVQFAAGKTYEAHKDLVEQMFDFRSA